ncbi:MAG TPA: hypothetical protein VLE46_14125 [Nitrospira sp.]|nr:hypothetical protein [Nitrospira sp.]
MPVGGCQSRLPRDPLDWNNQDATTHYFDQLAQVVKQIIDSGMSQVSELDLTGRTVQPSGNLAISFDQ